MPTTISGRPGPRQSGAGAGVSDKVRPQVRTARQTLGTQGGTQ
jgi:hypothetical protein